MSQRIDDGFSTIISFANGAMRFYEKNVTPPGLDGGGENDVTTMRNTKYRTRSPKKLITLSNMSVTVAYDPQVLSPAGALAQLNVNQLITVTFPDASTYAFWGWLNHFAPGEMQEGSQPTATIEIIPSNHDNTAPLPNEVAPVYTGT